MTVPVNQTFVSLLGNGSNTSWDWGFVLGDISYLKVYTKNLTTGLVTLIDPSQYTVSGVAPLYTAGGTVTYPLTGSPLTTGYALIISREAPLTQLLDLINQDGFYPDTLEAELDKIQFQVQQLADALGRTLQTAPFASEAYGPLPDPATIANELLFVDRSGNITGLDPSTLPGSSAVNVLGNSPTTPIAQDIVTRSLAAKITDAPSDGTAYVRENAAWVQQTALSISDAVIPINPAGAETNVAPSRHTTSLALSGKTNAADLLATNGGTRVNFTNLWNNSKAATLSLQSKLSEYVNVLDYAIGGQTGFDGSDWTQAFINALATQRSVWVPEGSYLLTAPLYIAYAGQRIVGAGAQTTNFVIDAVNHTFAQGARPVGAPVWPGINNRGAWASGTTYTLGDYVTSGGNTYKFKDGCNYVSTTAPTADTDHWVVATAASITTTGYVDGVIYICDLGAGTIAETLAGVEHIGFSFIDSGSTRATITRYPYAIVASTSRPYIGDVRIRGGWNGIYMDRNAGGLVGGFWELGTYNIGVMTDGSFDTKTVETIRVWPYGCGTAIYGDGNNTAMIVGADDGLVVLHLFTLQATIKTCLGTKQNADGTIDTVHVANGPLVFEIGSLQMDTALNGFNHEAGNVIAHGGYFSSGGAGYYAVRQNVTSALDGGFIWSNVFILCGAGSSAPFFTTSTNDGTMQISNAFIRGTETAAQTVFLHLGGAMMLRNIRIDEGGTINRTIGFVYCGGGALSMSGFSFPGLAGGSGPCLQILNNGSHQIEILDTGGWSVSLPSSISVGNYTVGPQQVAVPTVGFTGGSATTSYSAQSCYYTINRNRIDFVVDVTATFSGTLPSGSFLLYHNIPYPPAQDSPVSGGYMSNCNIDSYPTWVCPQGANYVLGGKNYSGSTSGNWNNGNFTSGAQFRIQVGGSYRA